MLSPEKNTQPEKLQTTTLPDDIKSNGDKSVHIITMHQMIDGGLTSSVKRRIEIAKENNADIIVFDIDTFGGRLDSAMEISEYIDNIKGIKTIAYIPHKAISAGALIAISCNEINMSPGAELGDCEPIIPSSDGGYKTAGEKIQTVLRTKFRKFAEKNGYPVLLSEAMVTSEIEIYRVEKEGSLAHSFISSRELNEMDDEDKAKIKKKKLIVEKGQLLTMHAREAFEYGFVKNIVADRDELLNCYEIDKNSVAELETNWSEEMVRLLEKFTPILLTIGIIAIFLEFKSPGFGLPGIVAILCFTVIFLSKYSVGLAEMPEIIIFFAGIALIAVEVFLIPGFGFIGVAGIAMMAIGLILSFQEFTFPQTPYDSEVMRKSFLTVIGSFLVSSLAVVLLLRFMPGIPMFNRLILNTSEISGYGYKDSESMSLSKLTGKRGVATTSLRPSGRVEIGETIYDVVTQGGFIEKGQTVEIVKVVGNHIVVAPVLN